MKRYINLDEHYCLVSTPFGLVVRRRSSLTAARVAKDPKFSRTRENASEFGYSARMAGVIRSQVLSLVPFYSKDVLPRLVRTILAAVRKDAVHVRGQRRLTGDNVQWLEHFEFSSRQPLDHLAGLRGWDVMIREDRSGVGLKARIGCGIEYCDRSVQAPYVRLGLVAIGLDAERVACRFSKAVFSDYYSLQEVNALRSGHVVELDMAVEMPEGDLMIVGLSVEFFRTCNGVFYPVREGDCNGVRIVGVSASFAHPKVGQKEGREK